MRRGTVLIKEAKGSHFNLVIKDYLTKKGLATYFHSNSHGKTFHVKGPMGKGLDIKREGLHVAFAGGTGILVFLDLVAHLIRKMADKLSDNEEDMLDERKFIFVLYVAF
mmetsp:Transcript_39716/g.38275  ORF Transcript_39716/g.38275 Transcript_39716/m.38275 type:complete len:109 (-) Transcript_39716:312-638(-)